MFTIISSSILASTLALVPTAPALNAPVHAPQGQGGGGLLGGFNLGIDLGGGGGGNGGGDVDIDVELGDCFGVDIEVGAACGVLVGVDALLECDPLSVEAACIAELGEDCGIEAFAACTAQLTAHCEAEVKAGGALFCDGVFVGADTCLGGIDVDVDVDVDACVDVDLDADLDLDLDLDVCLDLNLGLNLGCKVAVDAACHAKCDPIAVEAKCEAELGDDCELHEYAACEAEVIAQCHADCEADGAVFCKGGVYVGADLCLDLGLGLGF